MQQTRTSQRNLIFVRIKNNNTITFVAHVPGPEDAGNGILDKRRTEFFAQWYDLRHAGEMNISHYQDGNGTLTVRIYSL